MVDSQDITNPAGRSLRGFGWYGLVFIIVAIFLFNSEQFDISSTSIMAYGLLLVGFKSWYDFTEEDIINFGGVYQPFRKKLDEWKINQGSLIRGMLFYIPAFALSWLSLKILNDIIGLNVSSILFQQVETTFIYQALIVTPIETLVFQVMIPLIIIREFESYGKISWKVYIPVSFLISQVIFSLFHYYTFDGYTPSLYQAFFIGLGFMGIVYAFGISAGMSTHLSWNLFVLGITSANIIGLESLTFMNEQMSIIVILFISIILMIKLFNIVKSLWYKNKREIRHGCGYNIRKIDC